MALFVYLSCGAVSKVSYTGPEFLMGVVATKSDLRW